MPLYWGEGGRTRTRSQEKVPNLTKNPRFLTVSVVFGPNAKILGLWIGLWIVDCGIVDCGLWDCGLWDCGIVDCGLWIGLWDGGLWIVDWMGLWMKQSRWKLKGSRRRENKGEEE